MNSRIARVFITSNTSSTNGRIRRTRWMGALSIAAWIRRLGQSRLLKTFPTKGDKIFESKKDAKASLEEDALAINDLQDALFAEKKHALLVVLQGIDTSGKDGATKEAFKFTTDVYKAMKKVDWLTITAEADWGKIEL